MLNAAECLFLTGCYLSLARLHLQEFADFYIVTVYTPNSGDGLVGSSRHSTELVAPLDDLCRTDAFSLSTCSAHQL